MAPPLSICQAIERRPASPRDDDCDDELFFVPPDGDTSALERRRAHKCGASSGTRGGAGGLRGRGPARECTRVFAHDWQKLGLRMLSGVVGGLPTKVSGRLLLEFRRRDKVCAAQSSNTLLTICNGDGRAIWARGPVLYIDWLGCGRHLIPICGCEIPGVATSGLWRMLWCEEPWRMSVVGFVAATDVACCDDVDRLASPKSAGALLSASLIWETPPRL